MGELTRARGIPALCVEIEHTGTDTQFYDKFSVRHAIALLLKYLWRIPFHRHQIQQESKYEHDGARRCWVCVYVC